MCGIAGIKGDLKDSVPAVTRMLELMRSRGPDSRNTYRDKDVALGHCRLKIIDLSSQGDQPMPNENRSMWLVFNGEIYNFQQLRKELEGAGHQFISRSDSEVILHGYEEWGADCLRRLKGMFAFCIWDLQREELFLARDRLGIKPLYYYHKDGLFIFASQVRAILASGMVNRKLSAGGLISYLDNGGVSEPLTMFEDVCSLEPAHYLLLHRNELKIKRYWEIPQLPADKPHLDEMEITERLRELLKETVRLHLVSDVPLGVFLSGGIDSSALVSLAAEFNPRIKSVCLVFKESKLSEGHFSRVVAEKYHTEHHEVVIDEDCLLNNLDRALEAMDEPTFDGINTYFVSRAAKERGLTVALSGLGGDEIFGGYNNFRRINGLRSFCSLWDKVPGFARDALGNFLRLSLPAVTQKEKIIDLIKKGSTEEHPYFWLRRLFTTEQERRLLKEYRCLDGGNRMGCEAGDAINQVSYLEITNYMRNILLRDTDFMSMSHSLEVRVPLLDHELVEFMFSVPGKLKIGAKVNKPLLVNSLRNPLPRAAFNRQKMGFTLPFKFWLQQRLRKEAEETLREKNSALRDFINEEEVLKVWQGFIKGYYSWQRPWALYVLKRWVNLYLR
jgi:asparagine synthase (glutamine-hydrolysing)